MSKIFVSFFIIVTPLLLLIVWMNLTPGHFNNGACGCSIEYSKSSDNFFEVVGDDGVTYLMPPACPAVVCPTPKTLVISIVTSLSHFDLNK